MGLKSFAALAVAVAVAVAVLAAPAAHSATYIELFSFDGADGAYPAGELIVDASGALYGPAYEGGTGFAGGVSGNGVVFKLTPPAEGQGRWTKRVLHAFSGEDGKNPFSGLIADAGGALYGTTERGGTFNRGVVFKLTPPAVGETRWTETVLHRFSGPGGAHPRAGLVADASGALYGAAYALGPFNGGVAFELTPPPAGGTHWTRNVLHAFSGKKDGKEPLDSLTADASGALYGTTAFGGPSQSGVVFELTPPPAGQTHWTRKVLQTFSNHDQRPSGLLADAGGVLYGTAQGGPSYAGFVFRLTPPPAGQTQWHEELLHAFSGDDGSHPEGKLIVDGSGALYGTTNLGGPSRFGVVFKLMPPAAGQTQWRETVLHAFSRPYAGPAAGLVMDASGALYGTTGGGGAHGFGTVYKVVP